MFTGWDISGGADLSQPVFGLMKGVPTEAPMASALLAEAHAASGRHGSRSRSLRSPLVRAGRASGRPPRRTPDATEHRHAACARLRAHVVALARERSRADLRRVDCYDRDVPGEDERAMQCYRELLDRLTASGYHSYRLGIQSSAEMADKDAYTALLSTIKHAIDPKGILAPGRYGSR